MSRDRRIHIPESISADTVGSLLFLSHTQCLLEGAHEKPCYILNHEFTYRVWTLASYLLSAHQFQILSSALGIQQTRHLGFWLYGAFSIMGKKGIKQIIVDVKCYRGEARLLWRSETGEHGRDWGESFCRHCHWGRNLKHGAEFSVMAPPLFSSQLQKVPLTLTMIQIHGSPSVIASWLPTTASEDE